MLTGKKIVLGVSGSIAAYKSAFLVRLLIKSGAEVKVLMTADAKKFVGPITLSTLAKNPVHSDISGEDAWNNHVELGLWADLFIIAPATANTIAKMAQGICDNILLVVYLSARCPVWIAPAMDLDMWQHPSTQRNIKTLQADGVRLIPVEDGELASGLHGAGRMAEPANIQECIYQHFASDHSLAGKQLLVTAGPTYEDIDPVRYIGNRSSGKMGIAIAVAAAKRGAAVHLVLGPSQQEVPTLPNLVVHQVRSAESMALKCLDLWPDCHGAVLAAAVADYQPDQRADQKIKKKEGPLTLTLKRTTDIALALKQAKKTGQQVVGFALETENLQENAQRKMIRKGFDLIVANSPADKGAGFQHDTNKVTLYWPTGQSRELELMLKTEVAEVVVEELENLWA